MADVSRRQFKTFEEYIQALKSEPLEKLGRRQLQDLAGFHMEKAAEEEDWGQIRAAFRYQDLAINVASSETKVAKAAVTAVLQVLPDEEESEKIDEILGQIQQKHELKAQNIMDRMAAEEDSEGENP